MTQGNFVLLHIPEFPVKQLCRRRAFPELHGKSFSFGIRASINVNTLEVQGDAWYEPTGPDHRLRGVQSTPHTFPWDLVPQCAREAP